MYLQITLAVWLALTTFFVNGQPPVAHSVNLEYSYADLPADDQVLQMIYGFTRIRMYADSTFMFLEKSQEIPQEMKKTMGPGLKMVLFKDLNTGSIFTGMQLDTAKIRSLTTGEKLEQFKFVFESLTQHTRSARRVIDPPKKIAGYDCARLQLVSTEGDTIFMSVSPGIRLGPGARDLPYYLETTPDLTGLVLEKEEPFGEKTLYLRASRVELDQPRNIRAEMEAYRLVSEEEAERLMEAYMTNSMGLPAKDKN